MATYKNIKSENEVTIKGLASVTGTASSGEGKLYFKTDGKPYALWEDGAEVNLSDDNTLTWGDSISGITGTGLTTTIGDNASAGTVGQKIVVSNTQTSYTTGLEINTGTSSSSSNIALKITALNASEIYGGVSINNFSTYTQSVAGINTTSLAIGRYFNTNNDNNNINLVIHNENNLGGGQNSGLVIYNRSAETFSQTIGQGAGIWGIQQGIDGCFMSVETSANINCSTYGLTRYVLNNTQSGPSTMQKIDTGTSLQDHLWLDLTGTRGSVRIGQTDAPSITTDKLYNVSGDLYWNGIDLTEDKKIITVPLLDNATDTAVGDTAGNFTFTIPEELDGWDLINAHASVEEAGTTGTTDIQVRRKRGAGSVDTLSTKITIDSGELTSYTATTTPVINTSADDVVTGDKLHFDVDAVSTTPAKGLQMILTFRKP